MSTFWCRLKQSSPSNLRSFHGRLRCILVGAGLATFVPLGLLLCNLFLMLLGGASLLVQWWEYRADMVQTRLRLRPPVLVIFRSIPLLASEIIRVINIVQIERSRRVCVCSRDRIPMRIAAAVAILSNTATMQCSLDIN